VSRKLGVARTVSLDVRYGHPALRSLDAGCASASCLRLPSTPLDRYGPPRAVHGCAGRAAVPTGCCRSLTKTPWGAAHVLERAVEV